jgi:hypothetical protein
VSHLGFQSLKRTTRGLKNGRMTQDESAFYWRGSFSPFLN